MVGLVLIGAIAVFLGSSLPGGFIPTEDQGYMFLALQLPDGASAQRTDAAEQKISDASARRLPASKESLPSTTFRC